MSTGAIAGPDRGQLDGDDLPVKEAENPSYRPQKQELARFPSHALGQLQSLDGVGNFLGQNVFGPATGHLFAVGEITSLLGLYLRQSFHPDLVLASESQGGGGGSAVPVEGNGPGGARDYLTPAGWVAATPLAWTIKRRGVE